VTGLAYHFVGDTKMPEDLNPARLSLVHELALRNAVHFSPGFPLWLRENAHIWVAFEREATRAWAARGGLAAATRGKMPHYSARTIVEVLRHHSMLREAGGGWKINDHCVPELARLYHLLYPSRAGFFETRARRSAA
jgi:hypothetical protein